MTIVPADLLALARQHGASLMRSGSEWVGPCVICGGRDRFAINPAKALWNCRGCGVGGDAIALLRHVTGAGFRQAREAVGESGPVSVAQTRGDANKLRRKLAQADEVWREAGPLGPAAHAYYERRGINVSGLPVELDDVLRFEPRTPWRETPGSAAEYVPCILARFTHVATGAPLGISRRRIDVKAKPRTLGPSAGGVVRLWPDEAVETRLVVGEGVETVLAAATRVSWRGAPLAPAWATVTTFNRHNLPPLAGIEVLLLLVDADVSRAGQHAAEVSARRWVAAGCEAIRLTPKELGFDFNDIVMAASP